MSVCDLPVVSDVCAGAEEATSAAASGLFQPLAEATGEATRFTIEAMWSVMDSTTLVDVTTGYYTKVYNLVFGIAIIVMLVFFLLQVITAMLRREPAALSRGLLGLAKSVLGSFVVLTLTALLLEVTDRACTAIVSASGTTMERIGDRLLLLVGGTYVATHVPGGPLLALFLGGLALGATFIVWISLLIRKALILIAVVMAPLALAGASWDATRGWVGRWATFVIALIVSKLVLVVIFLLATANVAPPIADGEGVQAVSDMLTGVVLLLLAGFAPFLTYKAISFIGLDLYQTLSSEEEAKRAVNRPVPVLSGVLNGAAGGAGRRQVESVLGGAGQSSPDAAQRSAPATAPGNSSATAGTAPSMGMAGSAGINGAAGVPLAGGTAGGVTSGAGGAASAGAAGAGNFAAGTGAGASAAGPAAPVAAGTILAKESAAAGPRAGHAIAGLTGEASSGADSAAATGRPADTSAPSATASASSASSRPTPGILFENGEKK